VKTKSYRQGDVPLVPVARIPESAVELPRTNGKVILAFGEVTGHHHRFESGSCATKLRDGDGSEFVRVDDVELTLRPTAIEDATKRDVRMEGMALPVRLEPAAFRAAETALRESRTLTLRGSVLTHEEHHGIVVAPGNYALPGQREYTAADMPAIRVAD